MWPVLIIVSISYFANHHGADAQAASRIVNGTRIDIKYVPYQVQIGFKQSLICGGSIIGPKHILTAAHCFPKMLPELPFVRVGSSENNKGGQKIRAKYAIIHKDFNIKITDFDVAVLVLEESIEYDENVQPIELADDSWADHIGEEALVTGYGRANTTENQTEFLMKFHAPIIPREECETAYGEGAITEQMFCAGFFDGRSDACMGDSGGPLALDGMQYGIVSWGRGCNLINFPGVYTDISVFKDWISLALNVN